MELVLTEVCDYLNNYFWEKKIKGHFVIQNGLVTIAGLKDGQYFRILGSTFNNGVHKYPTSVDNKLIDEEFDGEVWAMAVPQTVIAIASNISDWQKLYGGADSSALSPFSSESFSGYSYSKSSGGSANGSSNAGATWQDVFGGRLNKYRRLRGAK